MTQNNQTNQSAEKKIVDISVESNRRNGKRGSNSCHFVAFLNGGEMVTLHSADYRPPVVVGEEVRSGETTTVPADIAYGTMVHAIVEWDQDGFAIVTDWCKLSDFENCIKALEEGKVAKAERLERGRAQLALLQEQAAEAKLREQNATNLAALKVMAERQAANGGVSAQLAGLIAQLEGRPVETAATETEFDLANDPGYQAWLQETNAAAEADRLAGLLEGSLAHS